MFGRILVSSVALVVLATTSPAASGQGRAAPRPLMLDNFEDGDLTTSLGGPWITYDDRIAGGRSSLRAAVQPTGGNRNRQGLALTPSFSPAFRSPFVGAQGFLNARRTPVDLRRYTGVSFMARGSGVFQIQVVTGEVVDHNYYSAVVEAPSTWRRFDVPFSALKQNPYFGRAARWNARSIRGVGVHLDQTTGAGAVEIDEVRFY